ncbi:MAG TPA: universal stress protein [Acidimicrobiales bacterium]
MQQHETAAWRQIVVGVDGSPGSQHALRWAGRLARLLDASVLVVHAVGLLEERHEPGTTAADRRAAMRKLVEHEWCAPLASADCPHEVEVRDGSPVDVLLGAAASSGAALVVTGCRGVGDNTALALGSTSLKLLQAARLPVLVVPEPDGGARPDARDGRLDTVMVGVDRSAPALVALGVATDLAEVSGASLAVVEVLESVPTFPLGPSTTEASAGEEGAAARAQSFLDRQAAAIRERGVDVRTFVRTGEPADALLDLADELDSTLVVVGTRGRGGPDELLLGSVARTVADRARRPTLVVPDPDRSD